MAEETMSSASSSSSIPGSPGSSQDPCRSPSTTPFEPARELLDEYQTLLSSTFDLTGLLPTQPQEDEDEGGKTMTKAEKQNAKKKRRKEREREAKLTEAGVSFVPSKPDTSIGFRLFSSCPIQSVKLEDEVVEYPCPPNPRHRDSTEEEKAVRRQRAEASAVTMIGADLGGPSTVAARWSRVTRQPRQLTTSTPLEDRQELCILSVDPDESDMATPASKSSRPTSTAIPVIEVNTAQSSKRGVRRGRSKRKKSTERPQPGYWRPKGGLGGKTQSTIWGYGVGMPVKGVKGR